MVGYDPPGALLQPGRMKVVTNPNTFTKLFIHTCEYNDRGILYPVTLIHVLVTFPVKLIPIPTPIVERSIQFGPNMPTLETYCPTLPAGGTQKRHGVVGELISNH